MKYIDLHCDALTAEGIPGVREETLRKGNCCLQVFAAFVHGERLFSQAETLFDRFDELIFRGNFQFVKTYSDISEEKINAILSVEEGGALEGKAENLEIFFSRGVRMMTLTWNHQNELGSPNFKAYAFRRSGGDCRLREKEAGLTSFGREIVERMCKIGMAVDVSHGSDALFSQVYEICRRKGVPFLASHSGAAEICPHARNLEDWQIRMIAQSGGVIGLDFCEEFTSSERGAAGQRAALLRHAQHILSVGGEDVLCLGSDFDGAPPNSYLKDPASVPIFLEDLSREFSVRIAEKIAFRNAMRFFKDVLPETKKDGSA